MRKVKFYAFHFILRFTIGLCIGLVGLLISDFTKNWNILTNIFGVIGFILLVGPAVFGGTFRIGTGVPGGNANQLSLKLRPDLKKHIDDDRQRGFSFGLTLMMIGIGICAVSVPAYFVLSR